MTRYCTHPKNYQIFQGVHHDPTDPADYTEEIMCTLCYQYLPEDAKAPDINPEYDIHDEIVIKARGYNVIAEILDIHGDYMKVIFTDPSVWNRSNRCSGGWMEIPRNLKKYPIHPNWVMKDEVFADGIIVAQPA
jgi:hypothetical protein